ncbi:MAG: hypothetical protein HMLKMBBP_02707 [Planctomycetes bacterium]|nr:hypothetical protein [Planctomycetota bacterium]
MTGYGGWALVTGASSGIGEEFARRLAAMGHPVALVARRADRLAALAAEIRAAHGVEAREIVADLADPDGPERVQAAMADAEVGFLVNNAGFGWSGRFVDSDPARDAEMIRLNCGAVTALTHAFLPPMLRRDRGAIVIVASLAGHQPCPWFAVYGATKAFDLMLAEALWSETRGTGVDVLALAPGSTKTEFSDVAHAARPPKGLDVADVVDAAFRALGRRPSVVPGWKDKLAAFAHRLVPRGFAADATGRILAADLLRTTPDELRKRRG